MEKIDSQKTIRGFINKHMRDVVYGNIPPFMWAHSREFILIPVRMSININVGGRIHNKTRKKFIYN